MAFQGGWGHTGEVVFPELWQAYGLDNCNSTTTESVLVKPRETLDSLHGFMGVPYTAPTPSAQDKAIFLFIAICNLNSTTAGYNAR